MLTRDAPATSTFPTLTTERVVLREITAEDAVFWLRNFSDSDVVELTAYEPPPNLEAAKAEIERDCTRLFREESGIRWGIVLKSSRELIGTVGYQNWLRDPDHRAQLTFDLLREHRRKGIMTEAMRVVLAHGFTTMGLNRVEALVDPRNTASIRLLEGLGFHRDAHLRQSTRFRDRFFDDVVFSLLAREWRATLGDNR